MGGVLILLLALTYLSLLPLIEKQRQLNDRYERLLSELSWLQEQTAVVSGLSNSCSDSDTVAVGERANILRLVRRNQLVLGDLTKKAGDYSLNFTASDANSIMRMAYQVACEQMFITRLEIAASNAPGSPIAGTMEISGVN